MALIKCPDCGADISDKAKKCIKCGKVFVDETVIDEPIVEDSVVEELKCEECGATLSDSDEVCPNCGCPVEQRNEEEAEEQQVEEANNKKSKSTKKKIIAIVIAVVVCLGGAIGYNAYSSNQESQAYQEYVYNLQKVQALMLDGGSDAESLCNLTLSVWYNSIYEKSDSETDKYTRKNNGYGSYYDDFNDALSNLFSDSSTKTKISNIENNQSSVKELMKKLQNPPEGLDNCYGTLSELYEAYSTLTSLATNPSGTYSTYGSNKNAAVSSFMSAYEKLETQIPDTE